MDRNELHALANELLNCYLSNTDVWGMASIAAKYNVTIGSKVFNRAVELGISWLESGDDNHLSPDNRAKIIQEGLQGISKRFGATLGVDFSVAPDGGMFMKTELVDRILADMSPEQVAEFKSMGYIKKLENNGYELLEKSLGIPFFANLDRVAKLTAQRLNNAELNCYINIIWNGLQTKHQFVGDDWAVKFAHRMVGDERLLELGKTDSSCVSDDREIDIRVMAMTDLLIALGDKQGSRMREFSDGMQPALSLEQMRLLDKVVQFGDTSFALLAAQLEAKINKR